MRALRALLAATLLVAACGGDDSASPPTTELDTTVPADVTTVPTTETAPAQPTTEPPSTTAEPTTSTPASTAPASTAPATTAPATVDVRVYFLRGERLVIDHRRVDGPAVLRGALEELVAGPSDGLSTAIPAGTRVRDVNLVDGTATVDLSGEFATGGGTLSFFARVGQIVFTATQFDNVDRVVFWLDGTPIEFLGGEGLVADEPWERMDVPRDLTGSVLVDTPRPGATVTSPFVVTGEADVYEGQFPIEIRRDGAILTVVAPVRGGAWGDWADFSATVTVDAAPGPFELVTYDEGGCGDDPECPPIITTVVALTLG